MATPFKYYILNEQEIESGALDTRYYTRNQVTTLLNGYVGKITGKSLVSDSEIAKLAGIEEGAEVNNLSDAQVLDLTDGGDTVLHRHDRYDVLATNLVTNGDFVSNTSTIKVLADSTSKSVSANTLTTTAITHSGDTSFGMEFTVETAQSVYVRALLKTSTVGKDVRFLFRQGRIPLNGTPGSNILLASNTTLGTYQAFSGVLTTTGIGYMLEINIGKMIQGSTADAQKVLAINLTALFGSGNEPTKEQMDWLISQKPNSWFNGTTSLVSTTELIKKAHLLETTKVDKVTGKSLVLDTAITDLTDGNETTLHKHNATNTPFTPTGNLSSTNVQTALAELDAEKASKTELYSLLNQDRRIFGAYWDGTSNPTLTRTGYAVGLTAQVGVGNQVVVNYFDNLPIWRWEDVTDNYGNVFKRIPKVYIRKIATDGVRGFEVSQYKHEGFYLPMCFWDFVNNKELDYVDVGKYQASKSVDNKLESKPLTYPLVNTSIVNFRTYARANGAGYGQFDIHVADLLQTLFVIEFATLNSQAVMLGFTNGKFEATRLAVLTETAVNRVVLANANAGVFRVGQPISIGTTQGGNQVFYGRTITAINVVDASNKELVFDGDPVNITAGNMVYNTGWRSGWSSAVLAKSGTIIANDGFYPMVYRGIESLYGDVWKWVDGININARQVWVCENQDQYVSNLFTAPFKQLSYINKDVSNYVSKMGMDFANPYANFPVETSGGSTTFYSDYYYQESGQRVAMLGSNWFGGADAGLFYWYFGHLSSLASIGIGSRLIRKAV